MPKIENDKKYEKKTGEGKCIRPWTNVFIAANGNVNPSCECEIPVGNIYKVSLEELWNSELMQKYRRNVINGAYNGWCAKRCIEGLVGDELFKLYD